MLPTFPWSRSTSSTTSSSPSDDLQDFISQSKAKLENLPTPLLVLLAFALGSATAFTGARIQSRYGKRLRNSDWITPQILSQKRWIKGVVTSVGDADNFRLFHTPPLGGWQWPLKLRKIPSLPKDLKDQTIHIRIAGVDAPEAAHFGKPSQPYAAESLAWLRQMILGKTVYCQILRRDQYQRIVAYVQLSPRIFPGAFVSGKSLPLEMLRSGWATIYEQAGAEYGKWGKAEFLRVEAQAKATRRGIWKDGVSAESPAEYKKRYLVGGELPTPTISRTKATPKKKNWWGRLWSRS